MTAFNQPITATKATALYLMHSYHQGKKPHDAIRRYIRHYMQPGDVVLDPFSGSGSTALAASLEDRTAIAIDRSSAATFITKNHCSPIDTAKLRQAYQKVRAAVQREMEWLYGTKCDRCNGNATVVYTVYSQVFQCPRCNQQVALFDCPEGQGHTGAGKPKKIRVCPHCPTKPQPEEINTSSETFGHMPVLQCFNCDSGCRPARSERRHNNSDAKKRQFFLKHDIGKLKEIESTPIPYWFPPHRMMNMEDESLPWGVKWRAGTSNFRTVAELFTSELVGHCTTAGCDQTARRGSDGHAALRPDCYHLELLPHVSVPGIIEGGFQKGTY